MNKLAMTLVLFAAALFTTTTASAHDIHGSRVAHQCADGCECECSRIRHTCLPIVRRVRATRRALCEYRCTVRKGFKVMGVNDIVPVINEPCHKVCKQLHPNAQSAGRFICDSRCHDIDVISPGIPSNLLP